jgi:hypothetical protein
MQCIHRKTLCNRYPYHRLVPEVKPLANFDPVLVSPSYTTRSLSSLRSFNLVYISPDDVNETDYEIGGTKGSRCHSKYS